MQLKGVPTDRKEFYKKFYGKNWEFHYNQWALYNTDEGHKQMKKYVKFVEGKK